MSTIRSILIQTCMSNVQKEIGHLEHWLNHLPGEATTGSSAPCHATTATPSNIDIMSLTSVVNRLSEQLTAQQQAIHHLMDRITILENLRQVHIDGLSQKSDDPWLDNQCIPLTNEIIGDDCQSNEPLYTFYKETSQAHSPVSSTPSIVSPDTTNDVNVREQEEQKEDEKQEQEQDLTTPPTTPEAIPPIKADSLPNLPVTHEEVKEEEEVVEEEEDVEEVEEVEEVKEQEQEQEEEVEEEEEEEGVELEEMEYKGTKYYRDGEGFIYTIDEDEQPSENPVGYWKEKTQTIAFYKTK